MSITYLWSREFLAKRLILWLLFISNALGTIYGYIWYGDQLRYTATYHPWWQLPFVPDSPTASLFFSIALLLLLYPPKKLSGWVLQPLIEALAVVTSVKYGIWACAMIFAGAYQGNDMIWQDWMLIGSHSAMAIEALIYVKLFHIRWTALTAAIAWTLLNDTVDYTFGVFPWLPAQLNDDLAMVEAFTLALTLFSGLLTWIAVKRAFLAKSRSKTDLP
ncbi:DUF1405 domain-containing protein [Paenibacillus lemnae]|uniref:DUF1405 domain-containing protein n=1 Tax=Paenibacillus lemnae TaxID=1330551 RepID=A0A848M8M5_PAELE|nr:DUF1405 domain-containing protein [Paenibacillus lemnae]NMO96995.1 DUF1405 domain-containing protein [Paenibacillus lemnae]